MFRHEHLLQPPLDIDGRCKNEIANSRHLPVGCTRRLVLIYREEERSFQEQVASYLC